MITLPTTKHRRVSGPVRLTAIALGLGSLWAVSGCAPAGGPGTYSIDSEGVSLEIEIPVSPEDPLITEILDYAEEMGTSSSLTWARVSAANSGSETRNLCDLVVLDESGSRAQGVSPQDIVSEAQDTIPIGGSTEDYNRGVELYNRTLDINTFRLLAGESTEYFVAFEGELSGPSGVFGGSFSDLEFSGCDNQARKID